MMMKICVLMIVYMFIHFNNEIYRYIHSPLYFCLKFNWCGSFLNFYSTGEAMWLATRKLHSHSLVAVGLSVGYDTLLPTGWHHTFVNSWCENRLGDPSVAMYSGSYDRRKFPPFKRPLTVLLRILSDTVQGHCTVHQISIRQPGWAAINSLLSDTMIIT